MQPNSSQNLVWVHKNAEFPEACMSCGMFTDVRITTKYIGTRMEEYEPTNAGSVGLGCLLFFWDRWGC